MKKRKKRTPFEIAKDNLWELCKQLTRKKYGNKCFTCPQRGLVGANQQTGHFIPSSTCGGFLRYDLRNLRIQCFRCNHNLGGNGAIYYKRMVETEGQEYVDQLFKDKQQSIKLDILYVNRLIESYQQLLFGSVLTSDV